MGNIGKLSILWDFAPIYLLTTSYITYISFKESVEFGSDLNAISHDHDVFRQ